MTVKTFLSGLLFLFFLSVYSQDIIVKRDNSKIKVKIFEYGENEISFKYWKYRKAPLQKIDVREVKYIKFKHKARINMPWYEELIGIDKNYFIDQRDGISYKTISFAGQTWMAENLQAETTKHGKDISWLVSDKEWEEMDNSTMAYCYYNNDPKFASKLGAMYNWETAQEVCPIGWHLPSNSEWLELENNINKYFYSSSKFNNDKEIKKLGKLLKESFFSKKALGFSAKLGGYRAYNGIFYHKNTYTYWWTSTKRNYKDAYAFGLSLFSSDLSQHYYKKTGGFPVRCIMDK